MYSFPIKLSYLLTVFFSFHGSLMAQPVFYKLDASAVAAQPVKAIPAFFGKNPEGVVLGVNNQYFEKNGQPWYPLMGEFHYWRYPAEYWEEQLLKMKSGGLQIVATYVYWGAHEKPKDTWSWSGSLDLRQFISLCKKHQMYVWLRPGPYINGDVRGRGFPDWIYTMREKRTNQPVYLKEVANYFNRLGEQTAGLYWGQGGPVIGVQLENEYASGDSTHISQLKRLATEAGIAPVYWSVTANTVFQDKKFEVLPLQGAYCYRGWERKKTLTTDFLFAQDQWIMEENLGQVYYDVENYPRGLCEQGAGMQETHAARFIVQPNVIEAHAHNQVGRGINMLGYFMFQGGTQYPGTEMPLSDGPLMPSGLVSYDYQAPLDEFGQVAESYKFLKLHHLFLQDFGSQLARTKVVRPSQLPTNPADTVNLRYTGRFNDKGQGYVYICNTQNYRQMSEKMVQVELALPAETIRFPRKPVPIIDGVIATWPVNLDFNGIQIKYATAQVLCKVKNNDREDIFLYNTEGVPVEICVKKENIESVTAPGCQVETADQFYYIGADGAAKTIELRKKNGQSVRIILLSRKEAENAWKFSLKGQDFVIISEASFLQFPGKLVARQLGDPELKFSIYPNNQLTNTIKKKGTGFSAYTMRVNKYTAGSIGHHRLNDSTARVSLKEKVPAQVSDVFYKVDFTGDLGSVQLKGITVADRLNYGKSWMIGLKRFEKELVVKGSAMQLIISGQYNQLPPRILRTEIIPEYEFILGY
ncbi:beta-galactosidase [Flavihumibacter sp. CACIAM 22H1]|uniref:beta-galactosidase n=1 Tax=Flavihumibacter sp. CACIAM 22H1 TaxID=1812911 RepID=UPI0007A904E3|nr:beta-galactosidase [Flavihumibacter sp. CACIAM 22H1]KYP15989.1 MAG: hypothetical protein A1D16_06935 [Flavihumibacter sp. CACIAM 22H1]